MPWNNPALAYLNTLQYPNCEGHATEGGAGSAAIESPPAASPSVSRRSIAVGRFSFAFPVAGGDLRRRGDWLVSAACRERRADDRLKNRAGPV